MILLLVNVRYNICKFIISLFMYLENAITNKEIVIIGAGPAGLTAALEILNRSDYKPIIIEANNFIGGISSTHQFDGYRYDIGPHRFFTKNDRVQNLWLSVLPLENEISKDALNSVNKVMLQVQRLTRILYLKKFFNYPVQLSINTLRNLGLIRVVSILVSYLASKLRQKQQPKSLEDFFIQRFGRKLYELFFQNYTEKVWGITCDKIPADWGSQRVKGLSILKVIKHAVFSPFNRKRIDETSLIESFMYPKLGAGQMYEEMAKLILEKGGKILLNCSVIELESKDRHIQRLKYQDQINNIETCIDTSHVFSSMPIKELVASMGEKVPSNIQQLASGLVYRDYIMVALLYSKNDENAGLLDNWIYVQEPYVKMGRLDFFHNFSKALLSDTNKIWLGAEYFCNANDDFWSKKDTDIIQFAVKELYDLNIGFPQQDYIQGQVLRVKKAYPAYFGSYAKLDDIAEYLNSIENLFCIGRNGTHKYNNMDHSILSAMTAVDNLLNGISTKENIWAVNTEEEYHEEK